METEVKDEFKVFRFVDDYLVCVKREVEVESVVNIFREEGQGLVFTSEEEGEEGLQFLDLRLSTKNGLCWTNQQRSPKPLLPFSSNHDRRIKHVIVTNGIKSVLNRACSCMVGNSLAILEKRFEAAGYPRFLVEQKKRMILVGKRED